jgi:soluble lytic murein transglycosylase-like protein
MLVVPAFAVSTVAAQQSHMTAVVRADAKTGRLVRSIVMEPKVVSPRLATSQPVGQGSTTAASEHGPTPADGGLREMIDRIAGEQGVETSLVHSVIRAESNYNTNAVSPKGAQGLMQLIPATARRFGVSNSFDPEENILGGVRYLRFLLDYYQGDYPRAIAAYNAGEGAVDKYNGIPPYLETRNYVYRVAKNLKTARESAATSTIVISPSVSPVNSETSRYIEASTGSDGRIYYRTP